MKIVDISMYHLSCKPWFYGAVKKLLLRLNLARWSESSSKSDPLPQLVVSNWMGGGHATIELTKIHLKNVNKMVVGKT